jgi:hypothetical protein
MPVILRTGKSWHSSPAFGILHPIEPINLTDTEVARKNNDTLSRAADVMYHLKELSDRYTAKNRILR